MNRIKVISKEKMGNVGEGEEKSLREEKYERESEDSSEEEEWAERDFQVKGEERSEVQVKQELIDDYEETEVSENGSESDDDVSGLIEDESKYKITKELGHGQRNKVFN